MHRVAPKKTAKQTAKPVAKVQKTRKVAKRTITTKRVAPKARANTTNNTVPTFVSKTQQQSIPTFLAPQAAFTKLNHTPLRFFGSHAPAELPKEQPYHGVQVEKYGKQKIYELYETDTPSFKKTFGVVPDINTGSQSLGSRPANVELSAQDLIEQFGVVLVDKDLAICDGTPDGPHPREFIVVNTSTPTVPQTCKYCGTRFLKKDYWDGNTAIFEQQEF